MDLSDRPLQPRDFDACLSLFRDRLAYTSDTLERLTTFWSRMLADDAMLADVIEDRDASGRSQIVALGTSVFVTDPYMLEAKSGVEPYLTARTIALELEGRSPILRAGAIRRANSGDGLSLLVLQYGEARERLSPERRLLVRFKMRDAFLTVHSGYRIKEILQEYWDEIELSFVLSGWGKLRTDYADYFVRTGRAVPPPERRPYLIGFSPDDARADPGNMATPLFVYAPPRFFFSPSEQELLRCALVGETDAQLAHSVGLAVPTVKGRWRQIYARVAAVSPALLVDDGDAPPERARGKEKRRPLLNYLRRHPEELRPYMRPRTASRERPSHAADRS
jgi:hypothetical protein